ncbi:hypothetical protein CPAV1605_888 [seawater metagenome]|uniref:Uncharacterized protein n=1 Tax=seawater metagenome TaxID=1561972 RepID=A0A5E8CIE8_9ZZZZ
MITIQISHFIFFIVLIIVSTIIIYENLFPGRTIPPKIKRINLCKNKIRQIPVYIVNKKNENEDDSNLKKEITNNQNNEKNEKNEKNMNTDISTNNIGIHSSAHSTSIIPSVWKDEDNKNNNFEFTY